MEGPDCYYAMLDQMFDNYFELDFKAGTLKKIKSDNKVLRFSVGSIRMMLDDALDVWINNEVYEEDRQDLRDIFRIAKSQNNADGKMRVQFRMKDFSGASLYSGGIIKLNEEQCWFGFNSISNQKSVEMLLNIYEEKKKNVEWSAKRYVVYSRAGVTVADYDYENKKYWVTNGFKRYKFAEKQLGYMSAEEAADYIHPDDIETANQFIERINSKKYEYTEGEFRLLMSDGEYLWNQVGVSLFYKDNGDIKRIIITLRVVDDEKKKESSLEYAKMYLNKLLNNTGNSIFTFRIEDNKIRLVYFTSKCSRYFGVTPSELDSRCAAGEPPEKILKSMPLTDEQFRKLIKEGNCVFEVTDAQGKTEPVTFHCEKLDENYFVTLYTADDKISDRRFAAENRMHDIKINTFGFFDVFVDGKPILFGNEKAKELLAVLVDRRGGYITSREAIGYLWENEPVDEHTLARYRKTAMKLKNTLKEYGIDYIIENVNGKRRIAVGEVDCDLYNYLSGEPKYMNTFHGVYMTNYSWGEITLAGL